MGVRDGLRSVANTYNDQCAIPGAGAFEVAASEHLSVFKKTVKGKARLGVEIVEQALLIVPKTLAENSGLDIMECILRLQAEYNETKAPCGLDLSTGECI